MLSDPFVWWAMPDILKNLDRRQNFLPMMLWQQIPTSNSSRSTERPHKHEDFRWIGTLGYPNHGRRYAKIPIPQNHIKML